MTKYNLSTYILLECASGTQKAVSIRNNIVGKNWCPQSHMSDRLFKEACQYLLKCGAIATTFSERKGHNIHLTNIGRNTINCGIQSSSMSLMESIVIDIQVKISPEQAGKSVGSCVATLDDSYIDGSGIANPYDDYYESDEHSKWQSGYVDGLQNPEYAIEKLNTD